MSDSRYAPPTAKVSDFESFVETLERPRNVTIGVWLLWIELGIGIPGLLFAMFEPGKVDPDDPPHWNLITLAISWAFVALSVFLNYKIWTGRNWARITGLVLVVVGLIGMFVSYVILKALPGEVNWANGIYFGQTLLDLVALFLLFSPAANAWYRAIKNARRR